MLFRSILALSFSLSTHAAPSSFDCSHTGQAIDAMQEKFYKFSSGTWEGGTPGPSTWNHANAMTALAEYMVLNNGAKVTYGHAVENTFYQVQKENVKNNQTELTKLDQKPVPAVDGGFINTFYDDDGWWALGWIKAYDATRNHNYLDAAKKIFETMTGGWDDQKCGGGIWWTTEKTYKNAIANELFMKIAASLANRVPDKKEYYMNWAKKELDWFKNSGMINSENIINDGLDMQTCKNNGQTVWTYNQGVILGALVEMNKAESNKDHINLATTIADAAIKKLSTNNVLFEGCEPNCGGAASFKGMFIRNLQELYSVVQKDSYKKLILSSADSLWNNGRYSDNTFGDSWRGPKSDVSVMSESAACDLFDAAYAISHCS